MSKATISSKFRVLIIEDNEADIEILKLLLSEINPDMTFYTSANGVEACDFLFKTGSFTTNEIIPDLILMDLNIPLKDGREILKALKNDKDLCKIPVVILSSSCSETEVGQAYCLGAGAVMIKPIDLPAFQEILSRMVAFYFGAVRLATRPNRS